MKDIREEYLRKTIEKKPSIVKEDPEALEGLKRGLSALPDKMVTDLFYMAHGFSDITDLDFMVIRADILVDRAMRDLAETIAFKPIPAQMGSGAVRNFVNLMTHEDLPLLKAAKHLSDARNIIAHKLHGNYDTHLQQFYTALGVHQTEDPDFFNAAVIIMLTMISNERDDWEEKKQNRSKDN